MPNWKTYVSSVLLITGLVGAAVFIGSRDPITGIPDPITVDGVTHTFTYTDSSEKENLLIYTDKEVYTDGFSGATMYLAVVNNSGEDQDVELTGYFADSKRKIDDVAILSEITTERFEPILTDRCEEVATTTGTATVCTPEQTGTSTIEETRNVWVPLAMKERNQAERDKENQRFKDKANVERKTVAGKDAPRKTDTYFLPENGVLYYRVRVTYPPNESTEMHIEVISTQGAYGFIY